MIHDTIQIIEMRLADYCYINILLSFFFFFSWKSNISQVSSHSGGNKTCHSASCNWWPRYGRKAFMFFYMFNSLCHILFPILPGKGKVSQKGGGKGPSLNQGIQPVDDPSLYESSDRIFVIIFCLFVFFCGGVAVYYALHMGSCFVQGLLEPLTWKPKGGMLDMLPPVQI